MQAGRPKSPLDLPKGWQKKVLALYSEGASDVEIKVLIWKWRESFSDDLWVRWLKEEPEFSVTIKRGHALSEDWWQSEARKSLRDKEFNSTLWYMNMKNRFGWRDKQELTGKDGAELGFVVKKYEGKDG